MKRNEHRKRTAGLLLVMLAVFGGVLTAKPMRAEALTTMKPKESTLTIHKTAEDEVTPLSGAVFEAYRVVSISGKENELTYVVEPDFAEALETAEVDDLGVIPAKEVEKLAARLADTVWTKEVAAAAAATTDEEGNALMEGLTPGYYLVVESAAPAGYMAGNPMLLSLPQTNEEGDGWNYELTVNPKNRKASLEVSGTWDTYGDWDRPKFTVKAQIPDYPDDYFTTEGHNVTFQVDGETCVGMDILNEKAYPVSVKTGGKEVVFPEEAYTVRTEPTETEGAADLTLTFLESYLMKHRGEEVEVTYFAKVNEKVATGPQGNLGKASITYSTSPTATTTLELDPVKMYSFRVKVESFAKESGTLIPLSGVQHKFLKGYKGSAITTATNMGVYTTDENGEAILTTVSGDDYYWIREETVPQGYTPLANPVRIRINTTRTAGVPDGSFTMTVNGKEISDTVTEAYVSRIEKETGTAIIAIESHRGFQLPATGGRGIVLFLLIGAAGMAAVIVLSEKKTGKRA